ncbi:hypothetical protein CRUP_021862, partial [Coryphaenoides rupestris]
SASQPGRQAGRQEGRKAGRKAGREAGRQCDTNGLFFSRAPPGGRRLSRKVGLSANTSQFTLAGEPFRILGGSMHYFRVPRAYWRDRLMKTKACGINTVTTGVPHLGFGVGIISSPSSSSSSSSSSSPEHHLGPRGDQGQAPTADPPDNRRSVSMTTTTAS